jgi:hypothetical protein
MGASKRGAYSARRGKASAAPCRGHASMAHVGPAIDGFRRARSDRDPASVARSPDTGAVSTRVFQLRQTTRGLTFPCRTSLYSFSFLNPTCTRLPSKLRSGLRASSKVLLSCRKYESTTPSTYRGFPVRTPGYFYQGEYP